MDPLNQLFIADKLRGIPLVSAGFKRENQTKQQINVKNNYLNPDEKVLSSRNRSIQSNLVSTVNSKKSLMQQTSSTTRKPFRTTSTTTKRPTVKPTPQSRTTTTTTTTATPRRPNKAQLVNISPKPINAVKLAKLLRPATILRPNTQTTNFSSSDQNTLIQNKFVPKTFASENLTAADNRWSSTQLIGLPDLQRRTPQTVLSPPRFINRRDESHAGENWSLFNRPDGKLSAFETLVLVSNVLIVSAIVLVILSNWFKSFKKKRKCKKKSTDVEAKLAGQTPSETGRESNSPSGRLVMSRNSEMSVRTPVSSRISNSSELITREAQIERHNTNSPSSSNKEKTGEIVLNENKVGIAQKITSETVSGAIGVANKAMAIVQPTENNKSIKSPSVEVEKKKQGNSDQQDDVIKATQQPISRTLSDFSGSAAASGVQKQVVKSEAERAGLLEDLFKGSAPDLSGVADDSGKVGIDKEAQQKTDKSATTVSRESLESIELPKALVDSIKQTEPSGGQPATNPAPSPNLLLGEGVIVDNNELVTRKKGNKNKNKDNQPVAQSQATSKEMSKTITKSSSKNQPSKAQTSTEANSEVVASELSNKQEAKQVTVQGDQKEADVKNHQVVVNKLDKRKTDLEIVDLRDESVIGRLRDSHRTESSAQNDEEIAGKEEIGSSWISMDGVAVVQGANTQVPLTAAQQQQPVMSPSEIIESKFHVDYKSRKHKNSVDSKSEEHALNSIEDELEQENKMRNRKYFVYIVHDGHFTAKKECIARIELPQKRRITLSEMRHLIANSQDISLTSLRRNRFKFVTETYRLLNENEDAAVLHQVYPTQGVFLKLNIPEQEGLLGGYSTNKAARARISSLGGSSLGAATISSRRRATAGRAARFTTGADQMLPAIEVDYASSQEQQPDNSEYGRTRASSVSRTRTAALPALRNRPPKRAKSSIQEGVVKRRERDQLPSIGMSSSPVRKQQQKLQASKLYERPKKREQQQQPIGAQMLSGAKRLFQSTFNQR